MNRTIQLSIATFSALGLLSSSIAFAEVRSLTSSQLTETYIKDSTIIVTPKKKKQETEQKTYSSLTIAPIENNDDDFDKLGHLQNHVNSNASNLELTDEDLREASIDTALTPELAVIIPSFQELSTRPIAEILDDPRYTVPKDNFNFTYKGGPDTNDLGLSRTGDQLTFSIGNLPNIKDINLPHGLNEGPVQLEPRAGGGFDLTINVPDPSTN